MKSGPSARWIWGMAFLMVLGPLLLWWLVTPSGAVYPITWMMPDRMSAAVRLANLEPAWQRHWQRRPQTTPDHALRELLTALDVWPDWVKKYGETDANLRLALYERALFNAAGDEAWLVFGEWGGRQPGTGQIGLMSFIRSRTSVANRVGQLMSLVMSDYRLSTHDHRGVTIYEYQDKKISRSVTFCQIGGWICASLQQRGLGPLPNIIDRVLDAKSRKPELAAEWWKPSAPRETIPAISAAAWPGEFWGQLRLFYQQRGQKVSDDTGERIEYWRQRLDGIERIELVQNGESLIDLKLDMIGPRPAELTKSLGFVPQKRAGADSAIPNDSRPQLAQLDVSLGLARLIGPLAGMPTETAMKGIDKLKSYLGGVRDQLRDQIQDLPPDVEGRIGLAIYPGALLPETTIWIDDPPERAPSVSPGQYWPMLTSGGADKIYRVPSMLSEATSDSKAIPDPADARWLEFERRVWSAEPPRPILFATMHFERIDEALKNIPAVLLGKKTGKRLETTERITKAISLAAPGAALRVDAAKDRWTMRLRTP